MRILILIMFFIALNAHAGGFSNYNNVLIGDMAAGLGGAFTGLTGDPSACSFYNPATLARMRGTSLSANASLYQKLDSEYGASTSFDGASSRINRGSFRSIPASAGSVAAFGPFALGLSIIVPDYDFFTGPVRASTDQNVNMRLIDESLWVGGTIAFNITGSSSIGLTTYYTSRFYQRSISEIYDKGNGFSRLISEEKIFNNNSIVYILGWYKQIAKRWTFGTSLRFPSIEVHGRGNYTRSYLDTETSSKPAIDTRSEIPSETRIPAKLAAGLAFHDSGRMTVSFDVHRYFAEDYQDLDGTFGSSRIQHREITNFSLGLEYFIKPWLRWRNGLFTNFSSHRPISNAEYIRPDYVDMWGFATNLAVFTSDKVSFTFGGYYTGGTGDVVLPLDSQPSRITKSHQVFTMLIGSAYFF